MRCAQINFQRQFGGGEVYTRFVARALEQAGHESLLFVHPQAHFWRSLALGATRIVPVANVAEICEILGSGRTTVFCHAPGPEYAAVRDVHAVACFAHMPMYGRKAEPLRGFDLVLPVSGYVRQGLLDAGVERVHDEPLYGVADLDRTSVPASGPIRRGALFDWDRRKLRDRLLGWSEPLWGPLLPAPVFAPRRDTALTLGIVSRITTIKQFPLLFSLLTPSLAPRRDLALEVFGSGGFASMRDLRRALAPLGDRVRWWGHQRDVAAVYRSVDYVLAGLPEREALGLNVIEAQACGTPVLAVAAPPFTETIVDGQSGFFYADPRQDGGQSFAALLDRIAALPRRPDPRDFPEHLVRFSAAAFRARLDRVLERLAARRP